MSDAIPELSAAPIVEAVVDIDCDMPPAFNLAALGKSARDAYQEHYPVLRALHVEELRIERSAEGPSTHQSLHGIQAFQFLQEDKKQLVQVRAQGYSFNRLAPYSTLDDYLGEIERTWKSYVKLVAPVLVRALRLRYINRILVPIKCDVSKYFKAIPQLPDESNLTLKGFLSQQTAVDNDTGNQVNTILTMMPQEGDILPLILDIGVTHLEDKEADNWPWVLENIQTLRTLKNRIFRNILSGECLKLFQH